MGLGFQREHFTWTRPYAHYVEPSGVQTLKNPNPLKDVEALAVLGVAVLV